jgi:DmsE family decaheme c-type cytochrome
VQTLPGKADRLWSRRWRKIILWTPLITLFISLGALALPHTSSTPNTTVPTAVKQATDKPKPGAQAKPGTQTPAQAPESDFVGAEVCKACHEDVYNNFEKTPHWKTTYDTRGGESKQGCEGCHGPGRAHAESGGDKTKIFIFKNVSAQKSSERCLTCHSMGEDHSNFLRSQHLKNNVSCVDCHSPHHSKDVAHLMKDAQPQLCYNCHGEVKPAFSKPFHHRVNEGLVKCSDCHNPHGGFLTRQLRSTAAQDTVCFTCHTDKAGPFAFEHAPVKTEGCIACHTPHGSSNPRLLKRSQVNLMCLECHTLTVDSAAPSIPSFHNQAQKYQACTMCHTAIHGSNSDHFLFRP